MPRRHHGSPCALAGGGSLSFPVSRFCGPEPGQLISLSDRYRAAFPGAFSGVFHSAHPDLPIPFPALITKGIEAI
jgi:hypothetical protein